MKDHRIENFPHWDKVVDYESDESEVTLLDENGEELASYSYCKFIGSDFSYFKKQSLKTKIQSQHDTL